MGYKYLCEILFFTKFYKYYDKTYYFVVDTWMLQILEVWLHMISYVSTIVYPTWWWILHEILELSEAYIRNQTKYFVI